MGLYAESLINDEEKAIAAAKEGVAAIERGGYVIFSLKSAPGFCQASVLPANRRRNRFQPPHAVWAGRQPNREG